MKLSTGVLAFSALSAGGWGASHVSHREPTPPVAPRSHVVASVELEGSSLPTATLRSSMHTRIGAPLDDHELEGDRARLTDILVERGYLAAMVGPPQVRWCDHGAHVRFAVTPGSEYRVRDVVLHGSTVDGARSVTTVRAGEPVSLERVARGAELIGGWLHEHDGSGSTVSYHLDIDHQRLQADVVYDVRPARVAWR
jgi:outer membrane protein assembly factor BamA